MESVRLADLNPGNVNILDATTRAMFASMEPGDHVHEEEDDHDSHNDSGDGHQMIDISLPSVSQTIDQFDPSADMIHIGPGISAAQFVLFEESGDALGTTVRIQINDEFGAPLSTMVLTGISLDDLCVGNFSAAEESVSNEIAAIFGLQIDEQLGAGGYGLDYDTDGSSPAINSGTTPDGGSVWLADTGADDIVGFDATADIISVGNTSVHGMIISKSENGEIVIDSPWSSDAQILQGVTYQDVSTDSFGIVGNEHFRQDIGAVLSWEQGIGPRAPDTVYIQSHEYGVHEVVDSFDPQTMKISFLYFGTRERLSVEDTAEGLLISSLPTGQSVTLTGVTKSELKPELVEFHHDQVMEDNLEVPFGFSEYAVTLVSRASLLTPEAPIGQSTDGFQTRTGDGEETIDPGPDPEVDTNQTTPQTLTDGADTVEIFWNWGAVTVLEEFDPNIDTIDFNSLQASNIGITEVGNDLVIGVFANGGNTTVLKAVQAEDLNLATLAADQWNTVTDSGGPLVGSLIDLGFEFL